MGKMRFSAKVRTENGDWIDFESIRWIALDKEGRPERICGPTGLQYSEFELKIDMLDILKQIIITAAGLGEIGCPNEWGFKDPEWHGKNCKNDDCSRCWQEVIGQIESY